MGAGIASIWPSGTTALPAATASTWARLTGRAVPVAGGQGLVAYPNGTIGTAGGFGAGSATPPSNPGITNRVLSVFGLPSASTIGNALAGWTGLGPFQGPSASQLGNVLAGPTLPGASLSQGPPSMAGFFAPQPPSGTMPAGGLTPSPSGGIPYGPPAPQQYNQPPAPQPYNQPQPPADFIAHHARVYRVAHGMGTQADADALNAMSLAAERAGRTTLPAGPYQGNVVNAMTAPGAAPTQVAQAFPTSLLPPQWQANNLNYLANQQAQNLQQQGVY